jgi:hypothetical protein
VLAGGEKRVGVDVLLVSKARSKNDVQERAGRCEESRVGGSKGTEVKEASG